MIKRTGLGVLAGILAMATEGLGSLYLIRAILHGQDAGQASLFTLITYLWLALNVASNAIGFVAARATARLTDTTLIGALDAHVATLGRRVFWPVVAFTGVGVATAMMLGAVAWPLGATVMVFVLGHVLRVLGLIRVFVWVGHGHLGADKWYQFICTALFYGSAMAAATRGAPLWAIGMLYLGAGALTAGGSRLPRAGHWPASPRGAGEQVASPAELGRQAVGMMAFAGAGFLAGNADALIARLQLPDTAFVQYALAAKLGQVVALVAGLFPAMLGPRITRLHHLQDTRGLRKTRRLSLALTLCAACTGAGVLIAAQDRVAAWFSPTHHEVVDAVLWIVAVGAILQAMSLALANGINSVGGGGLTLLTLASAITAVATASAFGPMAGAAGIASGTVCGSVVMVLGCLWLDRRTFRPVVTQSPST